MVKRCPAAQGIEDDGADDLPVVAAGKAVHPAPVAQGCGCRLMMADDGREHLHGRTRMTGKLHRQAS